MRNKIIALAACLLLTASYASAGDSVTMSLTSTTTGKQLYAAKTGADASTLTSTAGLIGKTSTSVGVGAKVASNGYCVLTQHISGTQEFGTASNTVTTYHAPVTTTGTPVLDVPTSADSAQISTGTWTSM